MSCRARCALVVLLILSALAQRATADELLVFAAASLTDVMREIGVAYTRQSGQPVKFSFAASSALARQIESGGRVDVFLSADREWMDYLQARDLIAADTRRNVASNRLALIAPRESRVELQLGAGAPIAAALDGGRLATGDPDTVPVGRYARAALESLGLWQTLAPRLVRADNVRSALAFVSRGEAPLGIVYRTDAAIDAGVRIVALFPADSHLPIEYPAALTRTATAGAQRFLDFLFEPTAQQILRRFGFLPPQHSRQS